MTCARDLHLIVLLLCLPLCVVAPGTDSEPLLSTYGCSSTGECYKVDNTQMLYTDAWWHCHTTGMFLAMPKTDSQMTYLRDNILGTAAHLRVWIGLTDVQTEGSWRWNDDQPLGLATSWKAAEPKDSKSQDEGCVEIQQNGWNNARCDTILKLPLYQTYPTTCIDGSPYLFGDNCYRIYTGLFGASTNPCPSGGMLAMPKDQVTNQFLYNINFGDAEMWIGLYIPAGETDFIWLDGTSTANQTTFLQNQFLAGSMTRMDINEALYAFMTVTGEWDSSTISDGNMVSYVCQFPKGCTDYTVTNGVDIVGDFTVDRIRYLTCNTGYIPSADFVTCITGGTWNPTLECTQGCTGVTIACGTDIMGDMAVNTVYNVTCDTGYVPASTSVTCMAGGIWSPTPQCIRDCGVIHVENGRSITNVTTEGSNHVVSCHLGYTTDNTETACLNNGNWDPLPKCTINPNTSCVCYDTTSNTTSLEHVIEELIRNLTIKNTTSLVSVDN